MFKKIGAANNRKQLSVIQDNRLFPAESKRCPALISFAVVIMLLLFAAAVNAQEQPLFEVDAPGIVLTDIEFKLSIQPSLASYIRQDDFPVNYRIVSIEDGNVLAQGTHRLNSGEPGDLVVTGLKLENSGTSRIRVEMGGHQEEISLRAIPGFLSIVPPLLAIIIAFITRQVILALFVGIWVGVTMITNYNPFTGFLRTLDHYLVEALVDADRIFILLFTLLLGGMVGVITRSGGTQGIVTLLARYANDSRGGQIATWLMGIFIFFDDYANALIVGNTMRPLTDKLKISREKLSYLVDSTAAPVSSVAIISTWIGYELSLISQQFSLLNIDQNPYMTFIQTIPYGFYPIFTLFFGLMIAVQMRDFGPMLAAEKRARLDGEVLRPNSTPLASLGDDDLAADEDTPKRWYNAVVPVAVTIAIVIIGLFATGLDGVRADGVDLGQLNLLEQISTIFGSSSSFAVLMWASFCGGVLAMGMALWQKILDLDGAMSAWVSGFKSMMIGAIILTLAWSIGDICKAVFTADYVVAVTRGFLSPHWMPLLIFVTAGLIAFATGTSYGTMAILMPIAIPLAYKFPMGDPTIDAAHASALLLATIASVLAGAVFGDHCSPISDTTIMSSMACSADHIDHVRTQMPYAATSAGIACVFGYIPAGFGMNVWLSLILGLTATYLVVRYLGKPVE